MASPRALDVVIVITSPSTRCAPESKVTSSLAGRIPSAAVAEFEIVSAVAVLSVTANAEPHEISVADAVDVYIRVVEFINKRVNSIALCLHFVGI